MLRQVTFREVDVDTKSNPPMWYAWPRACPMMAAKAAAGEPAPMACQGGHVDQHGVRHFFTCCWHSDLGCVDQHNDEMVVPCYYNAETDFWNRPMGRIDADYYKPQELGPMN
jgi:hypothetical protein